MINTIVTQIDTILYSKFIGRYMSITDYKWNKCTGYVNGGVYCYIYYRELTFNVHKKDSELACKMEGSRKWEWHVHTGWEEW